MSAFYVTALILTGATILFMWNRLPVSIVALGVPIALYATGVITLEQATAGFGDPAVVFIATLFILAAGLERTGVTAWIAHRLIVRSQAGGPNRLLVLSMLTSMVLAAVMSPHGAITALLPAVLLSASRLGRDPSTVLMPLVFAAHAGSMLALTGTSVNVLVANTAAQTALARFAFLEFALVGVPLCVGTLVILLLRPVKAAPGAAATLPPDFSRHARTLVEHYGLADGLHQFRVKPHSPLIGRGVDALDLGDGLRFVAAQDGETQAPLARTDLGEGDYLIVQGPPEAAAAFATRHLLAFREAAGGDTTLFDKKSGLAEIMIPPRSALIGRRVHQGMLAESGDLVVLSIQREGAALPPGPVELRPGDTLLLQGTWQALDRRLAHPDVLLVNSPELVRCQAIVLGQGAAIALAALAGFVALLVLGAVPAAVAGLLAVGVLLISGVLDVEQIYRSISWTSIILVGAMLPLTAALRDVGIADAVARAIVDGTGGTTVAVLAVMFVLTAVVGQVVSAAATALMVIPLGVAVAASLGVSAAPVLMTVAVACAVSFLTPVATSVNLMVMGPGGYKFGDFARFGWPLLLLYFGIGVMLVPLIWRP